MKTDWKKDRPLAPLVRTRIPFVRVLSSWYHYIVVRASIYTFWETHKFKPLFLLSVPSPQIWEDHAQFYQVRSICTYCSYMISHIPVSRLEAFVLCFRMANWPCCSANCGQKALLLCSGHMPYHLLLSAVKLCPQVLYWVCTTVASSTAQEQAVMSFHWMKKKIIDSATLIQENEHPREQEAWGFPSPHQD